ncbi:hypothetical protein RGUI_4357 (plasmid) [Rhodovulum sp. P5]|uniref:hypothetical protein n=1 Tax=Rhodovulum sp. P5 TaxID=1564506 RepID=UPI0009C322DF|nr:hypothetical protein [Rhodovulum sp. P5]ARE42383.1 hypothetical protein RGUI_4357 [Rhodovulum sp. P5]
MKRPGPILRMAGRGACAVLLGLVTQGPGAQVASAADFRLVDMMLCNYPRCAADNARFVQTLPDLAGHSVELDVLIDVPIGTGDYNAECIDKNPYLDAPEEFFFVPGSLESCDVRGGVVLRVAPDSYLLEQSVSFSRIIRVRGRFTVIPQGPAPIYALTPAP